MAMEPANAVPLDLEKSEGAGRVGALIEAAVDPVSTGQDPWLMISGPTRSAIK